MSESYEKLVKPVADKLELASKIDGASINLNGGYAGHLAKGLRAMARRLDRLELRDELRRQNRKLWLETIVGVAIILAIGAAGWWYRS